MWFYYCCGIPIDAVTVVFVHRSVWPLDFASASPTRTRCSGRASHTMCATIRRATKRSSNSRCSNSNSSKTATVPKSRSCATTCRRTRSRPETRWDPPQVRTTRAGVSADVYERRRQQRTVLFHLYINWRCFPNTALPYKSKLMRENEHK